MKAAVFHRAHEPLSIETVTVDKPQDREVLVRTVATGVCHSDLHYVDGDLPARSHPMVMGHEGSGVVEAVGSAVTTVKPGDHVLDFYRQGRLNLDDMVSKRGKLEDVNEAFRAMKAGEVARTVLTFD